MKHMYYMNVPLNNKGIKEFDNYDDSMPNVRTFELTKNEFMSLWKTGSLFDVFDKKFDIIIDHSEEERIELENLSEAITVTKNFLKKAKDPIEKAASQKVLESLELALKSKTFWEIDIFLVV